MTRKNLLVIWSSQTGRTEALMRAACDGAAEFADEVDLRVLKALEAGVDDLLWADGLIIATPENFGYMSGMMKDFLERIFYDCEGKVAGRPWALVVSAISPGRVLHRACSVNQFATRTHQS